MNRTAILLSLTLALGCTSAFAEDKSSDKANIRADTNAQTTPKADNTDINERDRDGTNPTAQTQSNAEEDLKLLAEVRRAVVDEESFSVKAQNVKIIVNDGVVMLRGPVENEAEKEKIGSLAKNIAGVTKVNNQLDIKSQKINSTGSSK